VDTLLRHWEELSASLVQMHSNRHCHMVVLALRDCVVSSSHLGGNGAFGCWSDDLSLLHRLIA